MSNSYYENGATHHDHHRELHINSVNGSDVGTLISAFFNNEAEEVEYEEVAKDATVRKKDGEPTFFVHPSVGSGQEWRIHEEIERLVARQGIQEICRYLTKLNEAGKVLLPQNAEKAYNELVRLGMPNGEGYSLKTFMKYYKR